MKSLVILPLMAMVLVAGCVSQQPSTNNTSAQSEPVVNNTSVPVENWRELRVFSVSRDGTSALDTVEVNGTKIRLRYSLPSVYPDTAQFSMNLTPATDSNRILDSFTATQFNIDGERIVNYGKGFYNIKIIAANVDYVVRVEELR